MGELPKSTSNHQQLKGSLDKISTMTQKRPPGPKGQLIMGVMREFNRDTLGFIDRCREYGDVVHTRFLYVHAYFLYEAG